MNKNEFDLVWKNFSSSDEMSWSWVIGGVTGGSCWNDGGHYSISAEEEPECVVDEFLEKVFPEITFLQYRKLMSFVKSRDNYEGEYYGNSTETRTKSISKSDILDYLIDIGLVLE